MLSRLGSSSGLVPYLVVGIRLSKTNYQNTYILYVMGTHVFLAGSIRFDQPTLLSSFLQIVYTT